MKIIKQGTIFIDGSGKATISDWEIDFEGGEDFSFTDVVCMAVIKALTITGSQKSPTEVGLDCTTQGE